ncbi:hypothetical protein CCP2SC5_1310002 [Azospirillaceae bacterium]
MEFSVFLEFRIQNIGSGEVSIHWVEDMNISDKCKTQIERGLVDVL